MGRPRIKMEGRKIGQLTVLNRVRDRNVKGHKEVWYRCLCDCGKFVSKRGYMLRQGRTHQCGHARGIRHGKYGTTEYRLWNSAKTNATKANLKFNLKIQDIVIPTHCPLLEIKLDLSWPLTVFNSPSVDRVDAGKGYTKDNIWIVSQRANRLKNNGSLREFETLVKNWRRLWHSSM